MYKARLGPAGPYDAKLLPSLPYTPGRDGAGIVVESMDEKFKEGDRVFVSHSITGTYATHCISKAQDVALLPARVSFESGVSAGVPCLTAHRALVTKGDLQKGQVVLVHGASGSVGLVACQMAREM